jgi:hypothetical protein
MPTVGRKAEEGRQHTQSVLTATAFWTAEGARKWLAEHDYWADGLDETEGWLRWRQYDPDDEAFDYRTKTIEERDGEPSIRLVIGFPKEGKAMKETLWQRVKRLFAGPPVEAAEPPGEAFRVTVLGMDVRQTPRPRGLSFALLVDGPGGAALVDPGPDVEAQVQRHLDGDVRALAVIVLTHRDPPKSHGVSALRALGCRAPLVELTAGRTEIAGLTWDGFEAAHEAGRKSFGAVVTSPAAAAAVVLAPHVRALSAVPSPAVPHVVLCCAPEPDDADPEYVGHAAVTAAAKTRHVLALSCRPPTCAGAALWAAVGTSLSVSPDCVEVFDPPEAEARRATLIDGARRTASKTAVSAHETPKSDADTWDGAAAAEGLRQWASSDGSGDRDKVDWAKYRLGFAWYDGGDEESFDAYKLPHHRVEGGELKVVWPGVVAAAAAAEGARGGADIPDADLDGVRAHLAKHYAQFEKTPPWEEK